MIPYLGCHTAREMLEAFVDGELSVGDQIAIESHLRSCTTCGARVEDMRLIGASIRLASPAQEIDATDVRTLATIQSDVLTRVRAERDQSLPVLIREAFEDARFMWPALGATAALLVCLFSAMLVYRATRAGDPESIATMIAAMARTAAERQPVRLDPLSSYYPVQLDGRILAPRGLNDAPALAALPGDEAVYALSAVVTKEGRIANYELLQSERAGRLHGRAAAHTDEVHALLDAVKHSRFEPAQGAGGGSVTVRVVWLVARTTVKPQAAADVVKPLSDGLARPAPRPARS